MHNRDINRLCYAQLETARACHVARTRYRPADRLARHTHDFCEVFWLESGRATHGLGGATQALSPGEVVFIRPDDAHGFPGRESFTLVNVALPTAAAGDLEARYGTAFWDPSPAQPRVCRLPGDAALAEAGRLAERLSLDVGSPRRRDAFLLTLFDLLEQAETHRDAEQPPGVGPAPAWLRQALAEFDHDDLREGLPALVRRAGRSREHLTRTLRKHFRIPATAWINARRLDRAAQLLRMSDTPIIAIAADVGFDELGYFYRLFKQRFATTPRRYRQRERTFVASPR
ncbi:MAG: AraC family transcriptional regulator [Planctomycetota bacterium]